MFSAWFPKNKRGSCQKHCTALRDRQATLIRENPTNTLEQTSTKYPSNKCWKLQGSSRPAKWKVPSPTRTLQWYPNSRLLSFGKVFVLDMCFSWKYFYSGNILSWRKATLILQAFDEAPPTPAEDRWNGGATKPVAATFQYPPLCITKLLAPDITWHASDSLQSAALWTLNTTLLTSLRMREACSEALHSVPLWPTSLSQVCAWVIYAPRQSIASTFATGMYGISPSVSRNSLNTNVIAGLGMWNICTKAAQLNTNFMTRSTTRQISHPWKI